MDYWDADRCCSLRHTSRANSGKNIGAIEQGRLPVLVRQLDCRSLEGPINTYGRIVETDTAIMLG
jgi:hypothetical protein